MSVREPNADEMKVLKWASKEHKKNPFTSVADGVKRVEAQFSDLVNEHKIPDIQIWCELALNFTQIEKETRNEILIRMKPQAEIDVDRIYTYIQDKMEEKFILAVKHADIWFNHILTCFMSTSTNLRKKEMDKLECDKLLQDLLNKAHVQCLDLSKIKPTYIRTQEDKATSKENNARMAASVVELAEVKTNVFMQLKEKMKAEAKK